MSNQTTAMLAKLALDVTRQRDQRRKAKALAAAQPVVPDEPQRPASAIATPLAQGLMREMFAMEDIVRGVFADLHQELRGKDGEDARPDQIEASVRAVFREMAPGLKGKDGKTVSAEQVEALVRTVFEEQRASLKGQDGVSADLDKVSAMVGQALTALGHVKPTAEAMQAAIRAEVQMIAPELRGRDGSGLIWRGEWQRGTTYEPGEVVRYRRATYIALEQTVGVAPGSDKRRWELMVRDGEDGGSSGYVSSDSGGTANVKWTLANTDFPYFGYTAQGHDHWKIQKVNEAGVTETATPDNNTGLTYAQAWASRTTLNYAT